MTQPLASAAEVLALMVREGRRRVVALAAGFSAVAIGALAFGVLWPKTYEAHALVLVEAKNIITPLMEGRAVATGATDQAAIVGEAMQSRRILRELLASGGWEAAEDAREEERMLARLSTRIRITKVRPELVRLSYVDSDPERTHAVARKLSEIYVRESMAAKARQSSEAFEFIARQVAEYGAKLAEAHAEVQAYYRAHEAVAAPPPPPPPSARPRLSAEELVALRAEEAALEAELGSPELRASRSRRAERLQQAQRELDTLLGTFTERHPEVRRARQELHLAQQDAEREARVEERAARVTRARLQEVRARLAAAAERPARPAPAPAQPATPELRAVAQDTGLSELLRRYESTRDVYQDLLKRRENARVSMELDSEQRGLALRVQEEPELPLVPAGLRLMHVTALGLLVAVAAPLGLLYAFVRLDPRVRTGRQLERAVAGRLLVTIPRAPAAGERARERRRLVLATALVASVFATYAAFLAVQLGLRS